MCVFTIARWAWFSEGWATALNPDSSKLLFGCGTIDFAGSGVVHVCGGFAALVFCIFIGPRAGRYVNGRVSHYIWQQCLILYMYGTMRCYVHKTNAMQA
jgi:ammonium transporter, Amt family